MTEGTPTSHEGNYERIRAKTTLKEILELACSFEESARDFYRDMTPKVGKHIRWVVQELAEEEQRHFELLRDLAERDDIGVQIRASIRTPESNARFADCILLPDLGPSPDDQSVLRYAMGREQIALEHYRSLAASAPPGPLKELFDFLANEEVKHKSGLERLYYETVHAGGA